MYFFSIDYLEATQLKKILSLLLVCAVVLSFAACAEKANITETVETVIGTKEVSVDLEENPTTGYSWTYSIDDESVIQYVSDEYIDPSALSSSSGSSESSEPETPLAGAPGVRRFTFTPVGDGSTTIQFKYARPFDEEGHGLWDMCYYTYNVKGDRATLEKSTYIKYCQGSVTEASGNSFTIDLDGIVMDFTTDENTNMNGGTIRNNSKILVEYEPNDSGNYAYFVLVANETGFDEFGSINFELHGDPMGQNKWFAIGNEHLEASITSEMTMDNPYVKASVRPLSEGSGTVEFVYGKSALDEDIPLRIQLGFSVDSVNGAVIDSIIFSGELIRAYAESGEGDYSIDAEELPEEYSGLTVSLDTYPDNGYAWLCSSLGEELVIDEYFNEYEEAASRTTYVISSEKEGDASLIFRLSDRASSSDYSGLFDITATCTITDGKIIISKVSVSGNALLPE